MEDIIIGTGVCVVMPVMIMWIIYRAIINGDNKRAEILIEAIRSNADIDTDRLADALSKPRMTPRERLNIRLLRGCIFTILGVAAIIVGVYTVYTTPETKLQNLMFFIGSVAFIIAGVALAVGISYLIVYFVTRKQIENNQAE